MSGPRKPEPVKLITSIFSPDRVRIDEAVRQLARRYGDPDYIGAVVPFDETDYYEPEMGTPLMRRFLSFETLIEPGDLWDIKLHTNDIEREASVDGRRTVNIDPGYVARAHLILATGKPYTHRPYVRNGLYADLTLVYRDKSFQRLEWTYPDYASRAVREMFNRIRARYLLQLKGTENDEGV